ncbi:MAG: hypothetical protein ACI9F9_000679, partial [Candidatus Paceibacteria bacterium]
MNPFLPLTFSLTLCSLASAQQPHESQGAMRASQRAIPIDRVAYDEPGDGNLWARGVTYKASFGADGATYIPFLGSKAPRNYPVRMQLKTASLGGHALDLTDSARWTRNGDTVILERGEVDVHYHLGLERIEQTFVIDRLTAPGDLLVRVAVDSELNAGQATSGFRFSGEAGGVDYGRATVLDAAGRSLAVDSRLEGSDITILVPDAFLRSASYPVVVDPFISTYTVDGTVVDTWKGDVAFDKTYQRFLHAYTFDFSQNDSDVYSVTIDETGTPNWADGAWIDMTSTYWANLSVANNNDSNSFLVACQVQIGNLYSAWTRSRQLPGIGMGIQRQLNQSSNHCGVPSVGGDANMGSGSLYCVAWGELLNGGSSYSNINYRMLNSNGTHATPAHTIDNSYNVLLPDVNVSKSNGAGVSFFRAWNVVWQKDDPVTDSDIHGAQIAYNGNILTPSFTVDGTPTPHFQPSVSAPLTSALGGAPDFLVVYSAIVNGHTDLNARMFKRDRYLASYDITAMEADVLGQAHVDHAQVHPSVATDGDQFIVAYSESLGDFGDDEVYVSSFAH